MENVNKILIQNPASKLDPSMASSVFNPTDEEKLLRVGSIHLHVQTCGDGWDYDVYDDNWIPLDGGQIDNPDLSIDEIIAEILEDYPSVDPSTAEELPLQMLDDIYDAEEARIEERLNSMPKSEA